MADRKVMRKKRQEVSEEQKQEITEAFNLFDTDKDQALDYHELKASSRTAIQNDALQS